MDSLKCLLVPGAVQSSKNKERNKTSSCSQKAGSREDRQASSEVRDRAEEESARGQRCHQRREEVLPGRLNT